MRFGWALRVPPADLCVSISTILKGLGLEGKLTSEQIAKKWDNLRTKYKERFSTEENPNLSTGLKQFSFLF